MAQGTTRDGLLSKPQCDEAWKPGDSVTHHKYYIWHMQQHQRIRSEPSRRRDPPLSRLFKFRTQTFRQQKQKGSMLQTWRQSWPEGNGDKLAQATPRERSRKYPSDATVTKEYCQNTAEAGASTQWTSRSESFWPRDMSQQSRDETATSRPRLLSPRPALPRRRPRLSQDGDVNAPHPLRRGQRRADVQSKFRPWLR